MGRGWCARRSQWTSSAARGAEEGGGCWRTSPRAASSGVFFATCTCPNCPHPRHLPGGQRSRRCGSDARLRDALCHGAQGDRSPAQGRGMPGARRAGLLGALLRRPMRVARPSWTTTYPGPRPQQGSHAAYVPDEQGLVVRDLGMDHPPMSHLDKPVTLFCFSLGDGRFVRYISAGLQWREPHEPDGVPPAMRMRATAPAPRWSSGRAGGRCPSGAGGAGPRC
jgi:hypothetical protein